MDVKEAVFWLLDFAGYLVMAGLIYEESRYHNIVFKGNARSGMGLLKCGNVVIPFDNTIEKGTELCNLYNTNMHEKVAQQKK